MTKEEILYNSELSAINHDRIRWFALILSIFSLILISVDPFISDLNNQVFEFLFFTHIFLFTSSIAYMVYFFLSKTKKHGTQAALLYSIAILINASVVSGIFDTILNRGILVYLLSVLVIGFSVYINKIIAIIIYSFSFISLLICLFIFQKDTGILTGNIINGSIFTAIAMFMVISNRSKKINELMQRDIIKEQKQNIEEKNKFLEEFNNQLINQNQEIIQQKEEITSQRDCIQYQNNQITSSIKYAKNIQSSILPDIKEFNAYFEDTFVLYKPKEIVSGDFYWVYKKNENIIFCVADCTGHGVPGAFMSLLGISFLNEIVINYSELNPATILNQFRSYIISSLKQNEPQSDNYDGLDIAFCVYNHETKICQFAGAHNSLYIVKIPKHQIQSPKPNKDNAGTLGTGLIELPATEFVEVKGDKMPVSVNTRMDSFTNHSIKVEKGDVMYLFTDGYADQFSEKLNKKFMYKNLKKLLIDNSQKPMNEQKEVLEKTLIEWIGDGEQIDDITVLGIKI